MADKFTFIVVLQSLDSEDTHLYPLKRKMEPICGYAIFFQIFFGSTNPHIWLQLRLGKEQFLLSYLGYCVCPQEPHCSNSSNAEVSITLNFEKNSVLMRI